MDKTDEGNLDKGREGREERNEEGAMGRRMEGGRQRRLIGLQRGEDRKVERQQKGREGQIQRY